MSERATNPEARAAISPHFVRGLDSFRFIAASVVAASHGGWIPFDRIFGAVHGPLKGVAGIWNSLPNGTLAVCVFFFISGFCIHYPNIGKEKVPVGSFLIKRFVRICVPLLAVIALAHAAGSQYVDGLDAVLWSVYCELAYYALYPLLFGVIHRRMLRATAVSMMISALVLALRPLAARPSDFGILTFLFCAPLWLLGAHLAERYRDGSLFVAKLPSVWLLRAALPVCAVAATFLFYHAPIRVPLTWSVVAFVPAGYLWLAVELQRLTSHGVSEQLERLGLAAYSMYLTHRFALTFFADHLTCRSTILSYGFQAIAISIATFTFYRLVEKPSHRLAKKLGAAWDAAVGYRNIPIGKQ
ncbi:acyltransferase family protein [Sphingomonas pruni]|uniref:acyltransferase family protein n=1 Tax=Sphingomonas pruni TaxID=40683 RepID=UPI000A944BAA|nr:acyltransferase [Sphingomonas pruni]